MLQIISYHLSKTLVKEKFIKEEDQEVYSYGIHLILMAILTIGTISIIGLILNQFFTTLLFLIILSSMRHYSGGYHANYYWQCYILSVLTYLIVLYLTLHPGLISDQMMLVVGVISVAYNCFIGSFNSSHNPKTAAEMQYRKKRARLTFFIYGGLSMVGMIGGFPYQALWRMIIWSQVVVMFSLLIVKFQGGISNENGNEKGSITRNC